MKNCITILSFFVIYEEMVKKGSILNIIVDKYKENINSECICELN